MGARLCLSALRDLGFDVRYLDLTKTFHREESLTVNLGQEANRGEGGVIIVHINPRELPLAILVMGRSHLRQRRIIGYWAWELPDIPRSWKSAFRYVDEVWVPSRFVSDAVRPHTDLKVRVVPHPVRPPLAARLNRAELKLPENAFVCLTMFDMRSGFARKNPLAAVRAFCRAFGDDADKLLVLKVGDAQRVGWAKAALERELSGMPNVRVIDNKLESPDIGSLMHCVDVVVSLHRSEGFGLVLAEAMMLGKCVVATGWSGNMAFMNSENSALVKYQLVPIRDPQGIYTENDDQRWAEADVDHAAEWLRLLASDQEMRERIGANAARDAANYFTPDTYRNALEGSC